MSSEELLIDSIKNVLECLKMLFSATDKETRNKAEILLKQYQNEVLNFATIVFIIVKSTHPEIVKAEKLSAIISLNQLISHVTLNPKELESLFNEYLKCLTTPQLDDKLIKNLNEGFLSLLNLNEDSPNFALKLTQMLYQNMINAPLESIKGLILIISTIINSNLLKLKNYAAPLEQILNITQWIHNKIFIEYIKEENSYEKNQISFIYLNDIMRELYTLLYLIVTKLKRRFKSDANALKIPIFFSCFIPKAIEILCFKNQNNFIITFTGLKEYDLCLNHLKSTIFKYINVIVNSLPPFITQEQSEIYVQLGQIILQNLELLVNNKIDYLINLKTSKENEDNIVIDNDNKTIQLSPNYKYSLLISYFISYLNYLFQKKTFLLYFDKSKFALFTNILLPLLIINKEEILQIEDKEQCEDYCLFLNDVIEVNKYKTIKSSVSLLIKTLYENDLQMHSFICKYTLSFLSKAINSNLPDIPEMSNEDKINTILQSDNNKKIDLSLLVFCIISETNVPNDKNIDNIYEIKTFFNGAINLLIDQNAPIYIKHKVILFIKAYLPNLMENMNTCLTYLFEKLLSQNNELLQKEAGQVLEGLISKSKKKEENIIKNAIEGFSQQILDAIKTTNILAFFDLLFDITGKFTSSKMVDIFVKLCERNKIEIERHFRLKFKSKNKNSNVNNQNIINKTFNIIRALLNDKTFVIQNLPTIEKSIGELFPLIDHINKIDFGEDLVMIITTIINHLEYVPKIGFDFLKFTAKYAEKNKGMLLDLYELINSLLTYGSKDIESNSYYIEEIYKIINASFNDKNFKKSPFYACILLQNWFIESSNIPLNFVTPIISIIIVKLNTMYHIFTDSNSHLPINEYNYLGYLTLLYVSFINYSSICINELNNANLQTEFKNWTKSIFKLNDTCDYEMKLIVIAICNILNKENFLSQCEFFLDTSVKLLIMQQKKASNILKRELKKRISCNFVEQEDEEGEEEKEDSDDDDSRDYFDYDDEKEVAALIKRIKSKFKDEDEYKWFKDLIGNLEKSNPKLVSKWIETLDERKKQKLKNILQTYRITVSENENAQKYSIPRKIVSIKRSTPK